MSLTSRVLAGVVLGLAAGALTAVTQHPALLPVGPIVEPVGTLWLNALRMTIIPLVVSLLVVGIATASAAAAGGRVGTRTLLVVACMLAAAALLTGIVAPPLLAWMPVGEATAAALRSTLRSVGDAPAVPGFAEWITGLVPANPIQAAAEGAMLPLVVFSILLGLAATRLEIESRDRLLGFFKSLGEGMMVIVQWVLWLAPIGVFALVYPLGVGSGLAAVGALGRYVLLISLLCVLITLALYPATSLLTGVSARRFARAALPSQVVAFSTRSSLASLPAMLESAQTRLGLSPAISGLVLPLAVSLMRITSPITNLGAAIFAAHLFGIALSPAQIAAGGIVAVLISLGEAGLPGQAGLITSYTPVFLTMGVPLEILGLLLAVETIPDTFATVGNVTADMAATIIIAQETGAVAETDTGLSLAEAGALSPPLAQTMADGAAAGIDSPPVG